MALRRIIGMAGVAKDQPFIARVWGQRFEQGMLFIALLLLVQLYTSRTGVITLGWSQGISWFIWAYFVAESCTLSYLVENRLRYLSRNWVNWIIILVGFPLIWIHTPLVAMIRLLRLILIVRVVIPFWDTVLLILGKNRLGATLLLSLLITIMSGIFLSLIDPNIHGITNGLWFAWESVTTVGYGDIIPATVIGKFFTAVLILMGIALISILTANFSAYLIEKTKHPEEAIALTIEEMLEKIERRLERIEQHLKDET